ncbi:restriction endonuclease subunit S [Lutimonas saemankumensis]|uniref:restriction endonuclease subunit S n=1 Tax=Lutimonas saemankumensis TaxID=483016 RepID=UPI00293D3724|nr:restriction endonuclease subunit S [Lutimonas saemankumensis]
MKKTLGELCTIQKGKIGIKKATPGEFPLVVTAEERLSHNEYHFEGNAVIIPLVSSTGHGHKSLKRIHFQSGKFAVGNILCAVIPIDENVLRADYLYRFLDLNREKELVSRMKGMANVTLPIKEIAKIKIPVPPIEAQIVFVQQYSILEEKSNDLGEEITHQLNLVKQLRKAFLREAMQGKLVPQDPNDEQASLILEKIKLEKKRLMKEKKIKKQKTLPQIPEEEIPFEIPANWVWCRFEDILELTNTSLRRGPFGSSIKKNMFVKQSAYTTKVYEQKNAIYKNFELGDYHIELEEFPNLKSFIAKPGDIIISCAGTIGETYVLPSDAPKGIINQALLKVVVNEKIITSVYFTKVFQSLLKDRVNNDAKGSAMKNLGSINYLKQNLNIPLPPLKEQKRILTKLDGLMQYCDELEKSIEDSQQQNELLLQQVLREALEPKEKEVVE